MALEALSSNDLFALLLRETLSPNPLINTAAVPESPENDVIVTGKTEDPSVLRSSTDRRRKKRRRKPRVCKNEEEAETQRMTHITVERNRRRQMNSHLSSLKSLMPHSYAPKSDQASIVGGAIDFIKDLEHQLHSLEAHKLQLKQSSTLAITSSASQDSGDSDSSPSPSLSQFFLHSCDMTHENKNCSRSCMRGAMADVEVTLIERHANIRILSRRRRSFRQSSSPLSKLVSALHSISLPVLHLTVTTMATYSVYSISTQVEERCELSSVEDIAAQVHHMLRMIEDEAFCSCSIPELPFHIP